MTKTDLETLDKVVFSNYGDGRNDTLEVMKIAFNAGANGSTFNGRPGVPDHPSTFEDWVKEVKKQLDK